VTIIGLVFGSMLGGTFLVETVFSWPGLGLYAYDSIIYLDFNAIMGVTIFYTLTYVFVTLLVDITYAALDPRIRLG
jgi:peptide/nickel transport system permease protein